MILHCWSPSRTGFPSWRGPGLDVKHLVRISGKLGTLRFRVANWPKNHAITVTELTEDFDFGESLQSGFETVSNEWLTTATLKVSWWWLTNRLNVG